RGGPVIVGAHYDHWYTGFNDNILGVAQAIEAFQSLRREGKTVVLTIFGAEEHGMPGTSSWYWAAGSREYASLLSASKAVEDVELYINFDMAGLHCLKVSGAPQYALKLVSLGAEWRCCECPECDSIMMAWAGVPTLSLHGLWCGGAAEIYHTPADTPDRASPATARRALRLAVMAALEGADWRLLTYHLREVLSSSGLRARKLLYIIEAMARRAGWGPLFRMMNQRLLSTIHYGSLRWESRELEAIYMPEAAIYTRLARDMERGSPPLEVVEVGVRERTLYSVASSPRAPHTPFPSLAMQHELLMKDLEARVEEIQRELIT
ncbi:MAG: M28 family peptidase, partial [Aeropyrum sp.]|nr:M28 family peptidase [Aeropyrum sp.]